MGSEAVRRGGRRLRRALALGAAVILAGASALVLELRADRRDWIREVAGDLGAPRVLERVATAAGEARRLELVNDRGDALASLWLRRPARLAPEHHVLVVYSGQETGRRILDLIPERDDLVLASPQYPYQRPRTLGASLRWPYDLRRAAFRTVAAGLLTVTLLEREERLDPRRILLVGASLGTPFAVLHGALDARVPRVLIVHGGGDLPLIVRSIEERRGRPWRGRLAAGLARLLVHSFEPLRYAAEISPRELIVVGARGDHQFPEASTLALFERAREPKLLRWTSGGHVRSTRDAAFDEVLEEIERLIGPPAAAP